MTAENSHFFDVLSGERRVMNFDFGRAMRKRHEAQILSTPKPTAGEAEQCVTRSDMEVAKELLPEGLTESGGTYFADSMDVRLAIVERIKSGAITLEQGQAELKKIKAGAAKTGKLTRAQAYSRG